MDQAPIMWRLVRALARQQSSSGSGGLGPPIPRAFGGRAAIAGWQRPQLSGKPLGRASACGHSPHGETGRHCQWAARAA